jgi:peptide/nickel transport system permease protein
MLGYVLRRLLEAVPVLFFATIVIFLGLRAVPGDAALVLAGPNASAAQVDAIRRENGLDQPLWVQYVIWLGNVVRGDLGNSFFTRTPVAQLLAQRLPATLELTFAGMGLSMLVGIPLGILCAVKQRQPVDIIVSAFNGLALGIPGFWLGILGILVFALVLGWLPAGGHGDWARDPLLALKFLALPAATLALGGAAALSRLVKSSMLEVLQDDYVRTARAKGLSESALLWRHALRNALVPVITVLGVQFGRLMGGAVITESVFGWPGVGRLIRDSITNRDFATVQACLLMLVAIFIVTNVLTDVLYGVVDPRIRVGGRSAA